MAKKTGGSTVEFRKFEGERGGFSVRYAGFVFWSLRGYVYTDKKSASYGAYVKNERKKIFVRLRYLLLSCFRA
jgi:hypothetical protein